MKMDDRKQKVLLAIVHDYIATAEPVGSRTIAKKFRLGVSPATIRNEMADLEEQGYIEQPHTSAGRVPSEQGYRYYVDYLMQKHDLSAEEEDLIRSEFDIKVKDIGQVIQKTGQLLSQLTHYTAMVLTPSIGTSRFKHIQLVSMNPTQAMVVVVMDNGTLHHRLIDIPESISTDDMETISRILNAKLRGLTNENIKLTLVKEIYFELARHKHILDLAMELLEDSLTMKSEDKIYLGGVFNMLNQPEFHNVEKVKTLLSILEQEKLLYGLMTGEEQDVGVTVRIGGEIKNKEIKECSMVTAAYSVAGRKMGSMGVLGPTRMEYAKVISVVDFMTKNLSQALERMMKGMGK
ncbi:Heat-inducible transcription repressor HrcA [Pelotomaculum schinkii]|uniref:Heat-inducible transcription repressor HrcA n=1 Tax=Pelotomaculum schinkii TaxID=78350 RepID=A0A4Y7REM8_9FIRM|nr:heat-inducible transcriptional repressor HrcA [Pelotomaculum schinkii]TEB07231.1 Heat-inducible transcription repressor HrcA [Pelotomaculum schinkii]